MECNRQLKCKLCGCRFKYAEVMLYHIQENHKHALVRWRQTELLRVREQMIVCKENQLHAKPVYVSVIKRNC